MAAIQPAAQAVRIRFIDGVPRVMAQHGKAGLAGGQPESKSQK